MDIIDILSFLNDAIGAGDQDRVYETTAVFTGLAVDKYNNFIDGSEGVPAFAYEVSYVDFTGKEITAWHIFDNGETPDPRELAGKTMKIRYYESETDVFEVA